MSKAKRAKRWIQGVSLEKLATLTWRLQQEAGRCTGAAQGTFYDEIGTLYHFFGQPEAEMWFLKAIEQYRASSSGDEPSTKIALVWWKAGHVENFRAECVAVLEQHRSGRGSDELADATPGSGPAGLSFQAEASFLLGQYGEALAYAERLVALSQLAGARSGGGSADSIGPAIQEMSLGILEESHAGFERGLDRLTSRIECWPTPRCSIVEDLFRYGLSLPICRAEAFIRWKMEGDADGVH